MNKIKMTLMEKANFLRAEMDMDESIIDWNNVEIIDDAQLPPAALEALEFYTRKVELEKELQKEFIKK